MRKFVVAITAVTLLFTGICTAAADPVPIAAPAAVTQPAADITGSVDPAGLLNTLSGAGLVAVGLSSTGSAVLTSTGSLQAASTLLGGVAHVAWCIAGGIFSASPCA